MRLTPEGSYHAWLRNLSRVYGEIRELGQSATHFVPDRIAAEGRSGYLVAYVFSKEVEDIIAAAADWYGRYLPLMKFGAGSAHSTILDLQVQPGGIDFCSVESQRIFALLVQGVQLGVAEANSREASIQLDAILHRETTVVACGIPTHSLWQLSEAIYHHCSSTLPVRRGWGSHITVARVTHHCELTQPVKQMPFTPVEIKPEAVIVGTLDMKQKQLHCYERFVL